MVARRGDPLNAEAEAMGRSKEKRKYKWLEDTRRSNDLMECFVARAATASQIASEVKDKPVAASSTDSTKT